MKKLSQKTKGLVQALHLLVGLGLSAPKAQAEIKGYAEISGQYTQFTSNSFLQDVYGNAYGGSIGVGLKVSPFLIGGKLTFLTGSGDYEKLRSFAREERTTQNLSIIGLEPYIGLQSPGPISLFGLIGYGDYLMSDEIKEMSRSWFTEKNRIDTKRDNVSGMFFEIGAKINIEELTNNYTNAAIKAAIGSRSASPIKGPYFNAGIEFKF